LQRPSNSLAELLECYGELTGVLFCRSVEDSNLKLDNDMRVELKKVQEELAKVKSERELEKMKLEDELERAREDLDSQGKKMVNLGESNKSFLDQIENLKKDLKLMRDHYESVQEDFAIKNSKLATQKEDLER